MQLIWFEFENRQMMVTRKPSAITIYYTTSQEETFVENLKKKSTLVHGCLLLLFGITHVYTIWFSWNKNRSIILDYLYLTHWNLTFHVFFLAIELLSDLSLSFDEMTIIFRNKFLHSILIPSSIVSNVMKFNLTMINLHLEWFFVLLLTWIGKKWK